MATKKNISQKRTVPETEQIDVRGGRAAYGDMVALGRILEAESKKQAEGIVSDVEVIKELITVLHPDTKPVINITNVKYAAEIASAVRFWREREAEKLKYVPTDEEKQAGYDALAAATGPTGVASTIAEKFGIPEGPDAVFRWPYASVFMVLYIDLERYKFQKRLSDIHDRKRKQKDKSARWGRKHR